MVLYSQMELIIHQRKHIQHHVSWKCVLYQKSLIKSSHTSTTHYAKVVKLRCRSLFENRARSYDNGGMSCSRFWNWTCRNCHHIVRLVISWLWSKTPSPMNITLCMTHWQWFLSSCLYHTTNILLHRPTLCARPYKGARQEDNDANPLVQCMTSATSIIALYDLYRRTFGDAHVVLSLAYSIYTASSIFLLHIQALKYALAPTLDKLRYCVYALERVKAANPGMSPQCIRWSIPG